MPVTTFSVKQVTVPLFGTVEAKNAENWRQVFAKQSAPVEITFDAGAFDFIAEALAIDTEDLIRTAKRYVDGGYREKARGLSGGHLGEFGEVLTYALNLTLPGRELVRVVGWRPPLGEDPIGRFPLPDFIVRENGDQFALEVKSREMLDYRELLGIENWKWLQPCSPVRAAREEALEQLGYSNGAFAPQAHLLEDISGTLVPFPVTKGIAVVVLVNDGRTLQLQPDARYKTPKPCRNANPVRDCWDCIKNNHAVVVTMPNAPGRLSLGGRERDDGGAWYRAYKRWTEAVKVQDIQATTHAALEVSASVIQWATESSVRAEPLREFWGAYLREASDEYGIEVPLPGLPDRRQPRGEFAGRRRQSPRPVRATVAGEQLRSELLERRLSSASVSFSLTISTENSGPSETLSIYAAEDSLTFNLQSQSWWLGSAVTDDRSAAKLATRLLSLVYETLHGAHLEFSLQPTDVVSVSLRSEARNVQLGWSVAIKNSSFVQVALIHPAHGPIHPAHGPMPRWLADLAANDPRVRILVRPEGRASLRISRAVLGTE